MIGLYLTWWRREAAATLGYIAVYQRRILGARINCGPAIMRWLNPRK